MLGVRQELLLAHSTFTDYQGRIFECSAYEYAWWAKDTHMRRMLEKHMDDESKSSIVERVKTIEQHGLTYQQNGETHTSKHADLNPLIDALQAYVDGVDGWISKNEWETVDSAWLAVGIAQRDVPVHVINEYCHPLRSFDPCPEFNEEPLPRVTTFYNFNTHRDERVYPIGESDSEGLGVDFSLLRVAGAGGACGRAGAGFGGRSPPG